ncbi:MAG: EAL domain-containing protein [Actinomycetota bacterium]
MEHPDALSARLAAWSYERTAIALAVTDAAGSIREANPAFVGACHGHAASIIGQPVLAVLAQPPKSQLVTAFQQAITTGTGHAVVSVAVDPAGAVRQWDFVLEYDERTGLVHVMGTDQTTESTLSAELRARTVRDRLTGLQNRDAFVDELDSVLATRQPVALFIVDVDSFTLVNDTYGHEFGDSVLLILGRRLGQIAGVRNIVARIGGDQFAIMMRRLTEDGQVEAAGQALREAATAELVIDATSVHLRVSIGYSVSDADSTSAAEMLREADTALSRAAELGGNRTQEFRPEFYAEMEHRIQTEADLRRAIGTPQLDADVQGLFTSADRTLIGFEALARWRHPVRGTVPPGEFIDVADRHGMLDHVLGAVLDRSLGTLAPWLAAAPERHVSVNVAPSQLTDGRVFETVAAAIEMSGVAPQQLLIEVTERELIADPMSIAVLEELHEMGVAVAIDDFGSGASSLGYLWTMPVSTLKLDRSLTSSILADPSARRIVASLVNLSADLGLDVIAEGVEVEEELAALVDLGCQQVQGFLLHRPCRLDAVAEVVAPVESTMAPWS